MTSLLSSSLFTDKPVSLSIKDYLIRKMAVKMMVSEKTIEAVVNHQFQSAHEALAKHKSLEISGFGKFLFNTKKAQKLLEKLESQERLFAERMVDENLPEAKRKSSALKYEMACYGVRDLKPRLYECVTDLRGVEEQPASPEGVETTHQEDQSGEIGNL